MTETMEQYMSKTRGDYGSGVTRPKIDGNAHFELKGKFLKELHDNTFSGSEHEDANEHIEKILKIVKFNLGSPEIEVSKKILSTCSYYKENGEINNFQQEPDKSLFQAWERLKELLMKCPQHYLTDIQEVILFYNGLDVLTRQILDSKGVIPTKTVADAKVAQLNSIEREIKKVNDKVYGAQVGCELCKGPHYTKDCLLKEEGKTLEEAYYKQFGAPYQPGGQYKAEGLGFYKCNNENSSYPDRRQTIEESLTKFMSESAKRHEENSNIIKEIQASTDASIKNLGPSIKSLEIQIG
nr:hypothetical protein [Tanacetum cinerariifolium]